MPHRIPPVPLQTPDFPASPSLAPLVVREGEGVRIEGDDFCGLLRLDAPSTGGAFVLLQALAECGQGAAPHVHAREDEVWHVLEGRFRVQVGPQVCDAVAGDTLWAPRDVPHSWHCLSDQVGRLLIINAPGAGFEAFLRETNGHFVNGALSESNARFGLTPLPHGIQGTPRHFRPTQGVFVDWGDHRGTVELSGRETGGALLLLNLLVDFRGGPPRHLHEREDETFFVLQGRFRVVLGETTIEASAGDLVFAPRGIAHAWQCLSEEGGRVLILVSPGENFEMFALELARQQLLPPKAPAALEALLALSKKHGVQILPPVW